MHLTLPLELNAVMTDRPVLAEEMEETQAAEITPEMTLAGTMAYEFYARSASPIFLVREIYKAMHAASRQDRPRA